MKKITLFVTLCFCLLIEYSAKVEAADSASPQSFFLDQPPQPNQNQQSSAMSQQTQSMVQSQPFPNSMQPSNGAPLPTIPSQYLTNQPSNMSNQAPQSETPNVPMAVYDCNPEQGLAPCNPYYDTCPPPDSPCGDCYCLYCHYRPCYYYTTTCEYVPDYCYQRCCRYVQEKYYETRCRTIPQYYNETKCRLVPQYHTEQRCQYVECYNEEMCCYEMVPQYYDEECCCYVPEEYEVTHCREVPEYYEEECCRYVPQYYYICHCRYVPKYSYQKQCRYVPQYYYKRSGKCEQVDMFTASCNDPIAAPCK